ncbi:probable N-acetyltransferase HLS1 [Spinacia oleracea]|uniref:Probable N-acetyltransferase HLS1 n=1 Tax=Spinacia oleracea TaxID=3562 RepID=A0A9R0JGX2_SPIOL|nr:probable N-acetyltransferase HLS1 [Spinacia oleracea]
MSLKIKIVGVGDEELTRKIDIVNIREYIEERDSEEVEEMERQCEFGQQQHSHGHGHAQPSLITHLLGDPFARIRHFPTRIMMVAESGGEIVGVIRGGIKTVSKGNKVGNDLPVYVNLAYILGLRVSPIHRQKGIATKLIKKLEEWCKGKGAEYVYMMTDCANEASIKLFTYKFNYTKFCSPTVLVQPVHAHRKPVNSGTAIVRIPRLLAESLYRRIFAKSELFPKDIDSILSSKLHLGTFLGMPKKYLQKWDPQKKLLPPCFAIMSVWNTKEVYQLQLKGVSKLTKACCLGSRVLDAHMPWLKVPSIPNMFKPFGFYFLYGLHMEGKGSLGLMKSLCNFAHNMARDDVACAAVVAEVAQWDPVSEAIPHWKRFSWSEDLWCMKKLIKKVPEKQGGDVDVDVDVDVDDSKPLDWVTSASSSSMLFVDPRDF